VSEAIEPFVPPYDCALIANHGAVTCGPGSAPAFFRMETIRAQRENHAGCKWPVSRRMLPQPRSRQAYGGASSPTLSRPAGGGAELPITVTAENIRAMTDADDAANSTR